MNKEKVIVVFDSGVGGLTVLRELKKHNINENFVYLADSANSPYGDKTKEQIIISVLQCFKQLSNIFEFKAIVIACNTASVYTKELLEHFYNVPVFSVVEAATKYIKSMDIRETIDVLATTLTIKSKAYSKFLPNQTIRGINCPNFVPFIESENFFDFKLREKIVKEELIGRNTDNCHYVVLACTHYPLLEDEIHSYYGMKTKIINPSKILGDDLSQYYHQRTVNFTVDYYLTGPNEHFDAIASRIMVENIRAIQLSDEIIRFHSKNEFLY